MVKIQRPQLRTTVSESDLLAICAAIVGGASYSQAAMAAGVRPSALRLRKRADATVARRLRAAWLEQGRRLRASMEADRMAREDADAESGQDRGIR